MMPYEKGSRSKGHTNLNLPIGQRTTILHNLQGYSDTAALLIYANIYFALEHYLVLLNYFTHLIRIEHIGGIYRMG